jgi:kynurenine formamidase
MRIIDLTQTLKEGIRGFSSEPSASVAKNGWNATTLKIYSHAGTHIDSPRHFNTGKKGIDKTPLENFIADCWIIELSGIDPGTLITTKDLGSLQKKIKPQDGLLFRTGWSRYINDTDLYRNRLPRLSEELVKWCIEAQVKLLGVEPPSVADVNNIRELKKIHKLLLNAGITIVEGLSGLDQVTSEKVKFIALPLKIENGDGAPCRAIAIES